MRFLFGASLALFVIIIATGMAKATTEPQVRSTFIDTNKDCIVVSSATQNAPIDFFESECRSFGGYNLHVAGSDLRYGPRLFYHGVDVELSRPLGFHDLLSSQIEWIYTHEMDEEGFGKLEWKGLLYQLSVAMDDGSERTEFVAVRLAGARSCVLGAPDTEEFARNLILDPKSVCEEID